MFNKKSILIVFTLLATITILGFNFKNSYSLNNNQDEEYKKYVISWIDEFQSVQEKSPIIFTFDKDFTDKTRRPIQLRIDKLNEFNYSNKVPEKYGDTNKKLLETIDSYKQNYEKLYEAISTQNGQLVGESVGNLYESDIILQQIEDNLKKKD